MSVGETLTRVTMVGGLIYGGLFLGDQADRLPDCVFPNPAECIPQFEGQQGPATREFGNLDVVSSDLIGTIRTETFGEASMKIGGTQSTFGYDSKGLTDISGPLPFMADDVDAKLLWNKGNKQTAEVVYNPCVRLTSDLSEPISGHPKGLDSGFDSSVEPPKDVVSYHVEFDRERLDANGQERPEFNTVKQIYINAGRLDTCFVRLPNTPANKLMWDYPRSNQGAFGSTEDATFRWMQEELVVRYAASQACPEELIDTDNVKRIIAEAVVGQLLLKFPDSAELIGQAAKQNRIVVELEGPEARRAEYLKIYEKTKAEIAAMTETFPDRKGNTYKLLKPIMGDIALTQCSVSKPVATHTVG